jgi:hypothetical protein
MDIHIALELYAINHLPYAGAFFGHPSFVAWALLRAAALMCNTAGVLCRKRERERDGNIVGLFSKSSCGLHLFFVA